MKSTLWVLELFHAGRKLNVSGPCHSFGWSGALVSRGCRASLGLPWRRGVGVSPERRRRRRLLSVRRWRLTFMIGHQGSDAQQATVIKRRTWGGALVLSGRRSRRCWNTRSMDFCQRFCNRVFQPPVQLRGEGVYSHGCKQGCFQPPRPSGPNPGWLLDSAIMQQGLWYSIAGAAKFTWARPPGYLNEGYEQRSFEAVGVLTVRDCRGRHVGAIQQPSGLGRYCSALSGGGIRCGAHTGHGTWPPACSAENLSGR